MDKLLKLPGKAYRTSIDSDVIIPPDALPLASAEGPATGLDPVTLEGVIIDNRDAKREGKWTAGTGLPGYVGYDYIYAGPNSGASIKFEWQSGETTPIEIRLAYQPHENRGKTCP